MMNTIVLGVKKMVTENAISKGFFVRGRIPQKDIAAIERAGMALQETSYHGVKNLSKLVDQVKVGVQIQHPFTITTYELLIHHARYMSFAKNVLKFMNIDANDFEGGRERKIRCRLKSYGTMTDEQNFLCSLCEVMVNDNDDDDNDNDGNSQEKEQEKLSSSSFSFTPCEVVDLEKQIEKEPKIQ